MIGWLRRRFERLTDDVFAALDPNACRDCLGECYVTVYDPWLSDERIDVCRTCLGSGKRGDQ